jgi:hypothetical protein
MEKRPKRGRRGCTQVRVRRTILSVEVALWIACTTPTEGCPIFARSLRKGGRQISGQRETSRLSPSFQPRALHAAAGPCGISRERRSLVLHAFSRSLPSRTGVHARASAWIPVADQGDVRDLELGKAVERVRGAWRAGQRFLGNRSKAQGRAVGPFAGVRPVCPRVSPGVMEPLCAGFGATIRLGYGVLSR